MIFHPDIGEDQDAKEADLTGPVAQKRSFSAGFPHQS